MPELSELFGLSVSPWELITRGSAMYWFLVVMFRFVLRPSIADVKHVEAAFIERDGAISVIKKSKKK